MELLSQLPQLWGWDEGGVGKGAYERGGAVAAFVGGMGGGRREGERRERVYIHYDGERGICSGWDGKSLDTLQTAHSNRDLE